MSTSAEHTRRALIRLTDGDDTSSRMKMHEAIEKAQKADALIYAIGIGDRYQFNVNEGALRKIAGETGGRAYFPKHERDLNDAFAQIQRDLREQYLVAYSPTNKARDGSYRKIEIQIVNPDLKQQNLKLNYRAGYFAKTTGSEPAGTRKRTGNQ
jgi:VWFA-related protein